MNRCNVTFSKTVDQIHQAATQMKYISLLVTWVAYTLLTHISMEALKGHVKFFKKFLYLLIRTYASPN